MTGSANSEPTRLKSASELMSGLTLGLSSDYIKDLGTEMRRCDKHKIDFKVSVKGMPWGSSLAVGSCPGCQEDQSREEVARLNQARLRIRKAKVERLGVPEGYANVSLSSYVTHTSSQSAAKQAVEELVSSPGGQVLVLSGSNGTGKTHLLCAGLLMADEGRYVTMMDVAVRIRSSYSANGNETEGDIFNGLIAKPLLAIDEIDKARGSRAEHDWLTYLVSGREARLRPTILATNRHFIAACSQKGCESCLESLLDRSIVSRITTAISIDGPDYRQANLNAKGGFE